MEIKFEVHWLLGENIIWLWDRVQGQTGPTFFFFSNLSSFSMLGRKGLCLRETNFISHALGYIGKEESYEGKQLLYLLV